VQVVDTMINVGFSVTSAAAIYMMTVLSCGVALMKCRWSTAIGKAMLLHMSWLSMLLFRILLVIVSKNLLVLFFLLLQTM
jgi:hypothetical protein